MITIASDRSGLRNHSGTGSPAPRSTIDKTPVVGSKMNIQTRPTPTPDNTYGAKTVARAKPRPTSCRFRTVESTSPSRMEPPTVATVKISVVRSTCIDSGLVKNSM